MAFLKNSSEATLLRAEKMLEKTVSPVKTSLSYLSSDLTTLCSDLDTAEQEKKQDRLFVTNTFLVNGKAVDIPSYQVKVGDVISIKDKYADMQRYKDILDVTDTRVVPEWLSADHESLKGTVVCKPTRATDRCSC